MSEAKTISDEVALKKFMKGKLLPIAKDMGYELTVEDLIAYEEDAVEHLSEEKLESVTGGINMKQGVIVGLLSAAATFGAGAAYQSSAMKSAQPEMQNSAATTQSTDMKVYKAQTGIEVGAHFQGSDANMFLEWLDVSDCEIKLSSYKAGVGISNEEITFYLTGPENKEKIKEKLLKQAGERMESEWDKFNLEKFVKEFVRDTDGVSSFPDYKEYRKNSDSIRTNGDIETALCNAGIPSSNEIFVRYSGWENAYNIRDRFVIREVGENKFKFLNLDTGEERDGEKILAKICEYDPFSKKITKIVDLTNPS